MKYNLNNSERNTQEVYFIANICKGKKEQAKQTLDSLQIPYYIPSDDNTLSFTFRYLFRLPNLENFILLLANERAENNLEEFHSILHFYPGIKNNTISLLTEKQYRFFQFTIHRETRGLVIDGQGVIPGKRTWVKATGGPFKGFEGVLPTDPEDGYGLLLEIPPLISWKIPVDKSDLEILRSPISIYG